MNIEFFNRMRDLENEMLVMQNQLLPFVKKFIETKVDISVQRCEPTILDVLIINDDIQVTTHEVDIWGDEGEFEYLVNIHYFIQKFCR